MFGRLQRIRRELQRDGTTVHALGLFKPFYPLIMLGALGAPAGTAGAGPRNVAQTDSSPSSMMKLGEDLRPNALLIRLPYKVLVVVSDDAITLYDWHWRAGRKREVTRWKRGHLQATLTRHRSQGYLDVHIRLDDGRSTSLTARTGFIPRRSLRCARAIVAFAASATTEPE